MYFIAIKYAYKNVQDTNTARENAPTSSIAALVDCADETGPSWLVELSWPKDSSTPLNGPRTFKNTKTTKLRHVKVTAHILKTTFHRI